MAKYIICDCARANWGKSTTLIAVDKLFYSNEDRFRLLNPTHPSKGDVWQIYEDRKTGKVILIQSGGDSPQIFADTENYLSAGNNVDVIICACHVRGATRRVVYKIVKNYGYTPIFFNNFSPIKGKKYWTPQITSINSTLLAQAIQQLALNLEF